MADELDFSTITPATAAAILDFLNRAPDGAYIEEHVQDDPARGEGSPVGDYAIGEVVAERLLEARDGLPGGRFAALAQLEGIPYFGQDKLFDLAYSMERDPALYRNRAELFVDGPACRQVLLDTIDSAQTYLHLSSFLFFNDEAGQEVAEALRDKAQEGLEVRVMLDIGASSWQWPWEEAHPTRWEIGGLVAELRANGVKVVDMQPIESRLTPDELDDLRNAGVPGEWVDEQEAIDDLWLVDMNHVDHRKMVIADGTTALVMSHGIGHEYLYSDTSGPATGDDPRWHDASTRITGGAAVQVNRQFAKRWMLSGGDVFDVADSSYAPAPTPEGTDYVEVLDSRPGDSIDDEMAALLGTPEAGRNSNPIRNFYRNLVGRAKTSCLVQNPYTYDDWIFDGWESDLSSNGGTVRLIRPDPSVTDLPGTGIPGAEAYIRWLMRHNDLRLLEAGATVAEYHRAMNHLKVAVVDGWLATHGSYNLNFRSAKKDLELNVLVESETYAAQMKSDVFDVDEDFVHEMNDATATAAVTPPPLGADSVITNVIERSFF